MTLMSADHTVPSVGVPGARVSHRAITQADNCRTRGPRESDA
jgi:hypothetical protein